MSYKTIAVYLDESPMLPATLALTCDIAVSQGAHVTGMAAGIGGASRPPDAFQLFGRMMEDAGVASFETRLLDGDAASSLSLAGRYYDLIVLGRHPQDAPAFAEHVDFCEFVAVNSACAVLVAPDSLHGSGVPRRPLVAWNGSLIAARAVHAALPLLEVAGCATVAMINVAPGITAHEPEPGAAIARYLQHHGISADLVRQTVDIDAGHALLALADTLHADLLVVGSHAHPTFNDVLHHGATRTVLQVGRIAALLYR
jgi:nucleotide-binding universal stress UspA family protein